MIAKRPFRVLSSFALLTALGLSGCADDAPKEDTRGDNTTGTCAVDVSDDTSTKPEVTVPTCDPPSQLTVTDIVEGDGPEALAGASVTVHYVGVAWSTKAEFDASWNAGNTFDVAPLGQASVIDGWNEGLMGAQAGDRRLLIIPPSKGYPNGAGDIKPGETLVFVVDVIAIS